MRKFPNAELPPVKKFHYHAGVFLSGTERTYLLSGDEKYDNYIEMWLNQYINDEGNASYVKDETLDDIELIHKQLCLMWNNIRDEKTDMWYQVVDKAYKGVIEQSVTLNSDDLILKDICIGTGVGNYTHYINRPTTENDLHGTGAFTLMCTEYYKYTQSENY